MTDMLLELSRRDAARRVVQALGLPLPLPRVLERGIGPWQARELAGCVVGVVGFGRDELGDAVAYMVAEQGAAVTGTTLAPFRRASEAFGLPLAGDDVPLHALLVDATALARIDDLRGWFAPLQPFVRRIRASGRLVVFGSGATDDAELAAVRAALDGFVRSAAKELGRRGATANLIVVEPGAETRAASIARFLLAPRSAFVTAQPIRATLIAATCARISTSTSTNLNASNAANAANAANVAMTSMGAFVGALDRKVAIVTGAGRGIGEATARRLAEEGAHVVCVDRPADEAAVAAVARAIGGSVLLVDVGSADAPFAIARHLRAQHGGVDIVVHNAGVTRDRTFAKMSDAEWNTVIDINLRAVAAITAALLADGTDGDTRVGAGKLETRAAMLADGTDGDTRAGARTSTAPTSASRGDGRGDGRSESPLLRDGGRIICLSSVA
ncbi:MAG TPA: SDR family oxidoreductase, partial [Kofleriaceae bacterium]|nr:SDR family oxidoreductase [Kofleriaceae bacterium]